MTARRILLFIASVALSVILIAGLIKLSRIDLRTTLQQLENVRLMSFVKLVLLNVLLVLVSTEKWRAIDVALRRPSDTVQPHTTSFALTSIGLVIGTFLPVQLAMSAARSLGTYFHGSAVKRGTLGTLYEQGFDVVTMALLAVATLLTHAVKGGFSFWLISAVLLTAALMIAVAPLVRLTQGIVFSVANTIPEQTRIGSAVRRFSSVLYSELLDLRLARRLILLSIVRFAVVVFMSAQTAEAVGLDIPIWHLAMAIPFIVVASVLALTPGGLGINEWTGAAALAFCGTPLQTAAQWTIAHRLLVTVSYLVVALGGVLFLLLRKLPAFASTQAVEEH